jgi:hypothetical protein
MSTVSLLLVRKRVRVVTLMAEQFPTRVRTAGVAAPAALGVALFGGTAPLIITSWSASGVAVGDRQLCTGVRSFLARITFAQVGQDDSLTNPGAVTEPDLRWPGGGRVCGHVSLRSWVRRHSRRPISTTTNTHQGVEQGELVAAQLPVDRVEMAGVRRPARPPAPCRSCLSDALLPAFVEASGILRRSR